MTAGESFVRACLPPEVERREKALGRFSARFAEGLPTDLLGTAFCSPASFRDPEADDVWHPHFIRVGFSSLLRDQAPLLMRAFLGGIRRFIRGRFGRYTFFPRRGAKVLGISPINICRPQNGHVETAYCHPEDTKRMSWLLFDDTAKDPEGYPVSMVLILMTYFRIVAYWLVVSLSQRDKEAPIDWATGSLLTLRWVLSLAWVNKWMLALKIRKTLKKNRPSKIHCVHEMHPHARIAWIEAHREGIPSVTVQHASIARTKLWYFPTREELAAGMAMPDEMAVFSQEDQNLLESYWPTNTRYTLVCGPRFSRWKVIRKQQHERNGKRKDVPILFAGSLPWWDNMVVLQAARRLLTATERNQPVWVRLHPASILPAAWRRWLNQMAETGKLTISSGPLEEALGQSAAVIGMNTTVLEEAALLGIPVVVLETEDYLSFATQIGRHISLEQFCWDVVEETIASNTERMEETIQEGRIVLGIDRPVFRVHAGDGKAGKPLQTLPEYT